MREVSVAEASIASNTKECVRACIGKRIVAVLIDAVPAHMPDLSRGVRTFVFDDGTGFSFSSKGSYWLDGVGSIRLAVKAKRAALEELSAALEETLRADGLLPQCEEDR